MVYAMVAAQPIVHVRAAYMTVNEAQLKKKKEKNRKKGITSA